MPKIAHLSDLHFSSFTWNPLQFFSKRWLGNLNLLFTRKKQYQTDRLFSLPALFKQLHVDVVVITGDLTSTSLKEEFDQAFSLIKEFEKANMKVFIVPGNHDHYTRRSYKEKRFYQFFFKKSKLEEKKIDIAEIDDEWVIISLDTALATPLHLSIGVFSEELEERLKEILLITSKDKKVILINHFPFFQHEAKRKRLRRGESLQKLLLQFPQVEFYLHGHTHRQTLADLRMNDLPIIVDCGSTTNIKGGGWNLIDLKKTEYTITRYQYDSEHWQRVSSATFQAKMV